MRLRALLPFLLAPLLITSCRKQEAANKQEAPAPNPALYTVEAAEKVIRQSAPLFAKPRCTFLGKEETLDVGSDMLEAAEWLGREDYTEVTVGTPVQRTANVQSVYVTSKLTEKAINENIGFSDDGKSICIPSFIANIQSVKNLGPQPPPNQNQYTFEVEFVWTQTIIAQQLQRSTTERWDPPKETYTAKVTMFKRKEGWVYFNYFVPQVKPE